jgi:hypothetical protein
LVRLVPDEWKMATISSIYKTGSKQEPTNGLTLAPCKNYGVDNQREDFMIFGRQRLDIEIAAWIRLGRSYLTNLLEAFNAWTRLLGQGCVVNVIYLNYPKAIDTVSHRKLLYKIRLLGAFDQLLVGWIAGILTDWKMKIWGRKEQFKMSRSSVLGTARLDSWTPVVMGTS